jgi:tRNA modification GTPase
MVRLSGLDLQPLVQAFVRSRAGWPPPRRARLVQLFDAAGTFDEGLLTWFEGPRSYTGEDLVELTLHGNPLLVERLLAAAVSAGARVAGPGEFTRRAFLNGRLDLCRAEAVLQAIEASTPEGASLAQQGLQGAVSGLADSLREGLIAGLAELEARLDHPGEELTLEDDATLAQRIGDLGERAQAAADTWQAGRRLVEGAVVALVGPVNAGKSSLFNLLGGSERALVSPTPGTTRDVVERRVILGPVAVTLLDTAGQRVAEGLEARGQELGRRLADQADLQVLVLPAHRLEEANAREGLASVQGRPHVLVANHADRQGARFELEGHRLMPVSARTGRGLEQLSEGIAQALVGEAPGLAGLVIASQRQRDLLLALGRACAQARSALLGPAGPAIAAEELYGALEALDQLSGRDTREEVLDALFSRFCIGK